jgi:Helix-turn-helix domain
MRERVRVRLASVLHSVTFCNAYNVLMAEELLTVNEAAERLGSNRVQIWRLIRDGLLEAKVNPLDRRQKLIPLSAIEKLESEGRRKK